MHTCTKLQCHQQMAFDQGVKKRKNQKTKQKLNKKQKTKTKPPNKQKYKQTKKPQSTEVLE